MKGYVQLRRGLLEHLRNMSGAELKIYNALLILADFNTAKISISQSRLSEVVDLSNRMTGQCCRRLEAMDYIKIKTSHNQWSDNEFTILKYYKDGATMEETQHRADIFDKRRDKSLKDKKKKILERDKYICQICGVKCLTKLPDKKINEEIWRESYKKLATVDHIIPLFNGGTNDDINLQTLCWRCNCGKRDKMPITKTAEPASEPTSEPRCEARYVAGCEANDITSNNTNDLQNPKKSKEVLRSIKKRKEEEFLSLWNKYPNKVGKKEALRHYQTSVKTEEEVVLINKALESYLKSERVAKGFIQNASTWFNDWRTWVEYKEELCPKCKGSGIWTSTTGYENTCSCPAGLRKRGER